MPDGTRLDFHPLADLFPLLQGEDFADLVADIRRNGLMEPIWLHPDGTILDGRNRYRACLEAGVEPRFRTWDGDGSAVGFVWSLNGPRRHLTASQKAAIALEFLPLLEEEARQRQGTRTDLVAILPGSDGGRARARAADLVSVSPRYIQDAKAIQEADPHLLEEVRAGTKSIPQAKRALRSEQAEQRRREEAAALREHVERGTRVDVRHGDFRDVLADVSEVDAIITDPPYPREYLPLLDDLAAWADRVLKPDGVLAVLFGQTHLPEVMRRLEGHRPYRWTMSYHTPGPAFLSHVRGVQCNWKPVLIYGDGNGRRFGDVVTSKGDGAAEKVHHEWGQDYGAFRELVRRLTEPGDVVVDPFMGAGTTLLAAQALGRHAIGCDIDAAHVETTRARLGLDAVRVAS